MNGVNDIGEQPWKNSKVGEHKTCFTYRFPGFMASIFHMGWLNTFGLDFVIFVQQ